MLNERPVKIPEIKGKINFKEQNGFVYVRYLAGRRYDHDSGNTIPEWINIGKRIESMPSLMYPNDNYEKYFGEEKGTMGEPMTEEEEQYIRNNGTYGMYVTFFEGIYHEFKQLVRKKTDDPVNRYKAENINKILQPLRDMMKDEEYAGFLGLIETGEEGEQEGMSYSDTMILLTHYKNALAKYHRNHL